MSEPVVVNERNRHIPGLEAEATPILGIGLGLTGLALGLRPRLAPLPLALTALAALLYRDPERATPPDAAGIFAVSDGAVQHIDEIYEHRFLHTDSVRISSVQSLWDVSVSRSPASGTVRYVEQIQGEYRPASDAEAAECNTRTYVGIDTVWGPMLIVSIAGPLARKLVTRVRAGDRVEAGERIGTARFGARTDLIVQRDMVTALPGVGQRLTAGVTCVARVVPL